VSQSSSCPFKGNPCRRPTCPRSGCGFQTLMNLVNKYKQNYSHTDHRIMNALLSVLQSVWNSSPSGAAASRAMGAAFERFMRQSLDQQTRQLGKHVIVRRGSRKNSVQLLGISYIPDITIHDASTGHLRTIVEAKIYAQTSDALAVMALTAFQGAKVALVTFHPPSKLRSALQQMMNQWQGKFRYFCLVQSPSSTLNQLARFV